MGSAGAVSAAPRAVAGLGYAYTEDVLADDDSHHRLFSEVAAAYAPWSYLQLSVLFDARFDAHSGNTGSESGTAFGTRLATRHAWALTPELALAARTQLAFPAASSVSRGVRAASPELGVIGSYLFAPAHELSLDLGFRVHRSKESQTYLDRLSPADLLGLQRTRYNEALIGALYAMPIGPVTASAEWSWGLAVGDNAPSALQSPMRVRLAAQMRLADRYVPGIEIGASPSARPAPDRLARIEPRFWMALNFGVVFERKVETKPVLATKQSDAPPAPLEPALLEVRVLDPAGAAIAGAKAAITLGEQRQELVSDQSGLVAFTLTAEQTQSLTVTNEGFEPHQATVEGTRGRQELTVTLSRQLPEGEIKGTVRSLRGGKLGRAHITVEPLGTSVDTDEKGDFLIVVPPGQYTLQITAPGFEPQERNAQVELLGVTILVVDLRRAPK